MSKLGSYLFQGVYCIGFVAEPIIGVSKTMEIGRFLLRPCPTCLRLTSTWGWTRRKFATNSRRPLEKTTCRSLKQFERYLNRCRRNKSTSGNGCKTVKSICQKWAERIEKKNVPEARTSVEYIIAHVLGRKTLHGFDGEFELSDCTIEKVDTLCQRRMQHEPVQYILKEWDFGDLQLILRPPVFIPRSETEELVDLAERLIEGKGRLTQRVLDVCCGSGAIILSLLHKFPLLTGVAVDVSSEACSLTQENAQMLGLVDRLTIIQGDVADHAVQDSLKAWAPFDILVSNPPYIPSNELSALEPQILLYEDVAALDGGVDGLDVVRTILDIYPETLRFESDILLEIQPGQSNIIQQMVAGKRRLCLQFVSSYDDYAGRERFCHLRTYRQQK